LQAYDLKIPEPSLNPFVAGSIPARPTNIHQEAHEFRFVGFLLSARFLCQFHSVQSEQENQYHYASDIPLYRNADYRISE